VFAADAPPVEDFLVYPRVIAAAPSITPYLRYQAEMAWQRDDERRRIWAGIRTEQDLIKVQRQLKKDLLDMLGGLPSEKTPLHARVVGKISMEGFHIEKLIFESLPGIYVAALVYVPEDGNKTHPAVLVPVGHAANGKNHYQVLCQRLAQRGYVVICWDAVGQGERSQFWDAKAAKSRYNLICAEHAVMGNLAYLAGTNLARWEIWDGIRAVDYLLTRPDVDPDRINITGTSGGGFQAAHIAALDSRIKVAAISCYITALPMRISNRIFKDPDSDPEQDLYGMVSNHVDHSGLLLMMYPRPVFVAAAVLDFFPIEGARNTVREVTELYSRFHHADRIGMAEGYHDHQYSLENQEAAIDFLDHFNQLPARRGFLSARELDDKELRCTRTGQVMLDYDNSRSLMDAIREYYIRHRSQSRQTLKKLYGSDGYPGISSWKFGRFQGSNAEIGEVLDEDRGSLEFEGVTIQKFILHHSRYLELPVLYLRKPGAGRRPLMLWFGEKGKASAGDWPTLSRLIDDGYDILTFDPRGLGETRMAYKAVSPDDPTLSQMDTEHAYWNPLSGVLAGYVYNSLLTGRPYFLQMMEDSEIVIRFFRTRINPEGKVSISGQGDAYLLARAISETFPDLKLTGAPDSQAVNWSDIVNHKTELWPIQNLLPGGAYIH
jgi:dienelactone hydrolase